MFRVIFLGAMLHSAAFSLADTVAPGTKAPALSVKAWYKGTPVTSFKKNKLYVVEFWATWCGPCRESIPHLTELAKKNKDVSFIGVSIWEDDKGGNIKKFVKEMGPKMDYHVGYSGNKTGMSKTWMEAAGQDGIPTAFVVKGGKVLWIGHPMELEKPLGEIKSGKFSVEKFKKDFDAKTAEMKTEMEARKEADQISKLIADGKFEGLDSRIDKLATKGPMMQSMAANLRFSLLAKSNPDKWEVRAKELASSGKEEDRDILCGYAIEQAQTKGDMVRGQQAIELALSSGKEGDLMLYYNGATFYDIAKEPKKALELMDKAIAAWPKSPMKDNKEVKDELAKEREAFAKKIG